MTARDPSKPPGKAGRPKGAKSFPKHEIFAILSDRNIEPIIELIDHMKDVHLPQHIKDFFKNEKVTQNEKAEMAFKLWSKKADIWKAISDYIYPKRRAVEVKGDIGKAPIFNITIPAVGDPSITQQDSTAATGIPIPEGLGSSSTGAKGPTKH